MMSWKRNWKKFEIIKHDIMNNKDALRLKKLGSNLQCKSFEGICPTCNQKIQDS